MLSIYLIFGNPLAFLKNRPACSDMFKNMNCYDFCYIVLKLALPDPVHMRQRTKPSVEVIVKDQINLLVRLQEKDEALDLLRKQLAAMPQQIKELERKVADMKAELEAEQERLQKALMAQREYEAEVEDNIAHVKKSKVRLLSIKSNKEYQALLKEIEDTERSKAENEDRMLAYMEEVERLNQNLKEKEKDLSTVRQTLDSKRKKIESEITEVQEELSRAEKEREKIAKALRPELLGRYEHIKARSGGIAVACVENATCSACHLNIPPQMYNELQKGDSLKFCPHCERFIYWKANSASK